MKHWLLLLKYNMEKTGDSSKTKQNRLVSYLASCFYTRNTPFRIPHMDLIQRYDFCDQILEEKFLRKKICIYGHQNQQ